MYTTTEIFREMLEQGMIDTEEYAELVCEYRNHVKALMKMDLIAKNSKEVIDDMKEHEKNKQEESNPTPTESIYKLLSDSERNRIKRYEKRKRNKDIGKLDELFMHGATSCDYVGYIRMNGRSIEEKESAPPV